MAVRRNLAERLAAAGAAPHDLVTRLANDQIEVARPVLEKSGVLRNADLLAIVRERGQEHLVAVSKRDTVDEEVSDALVARGDDAVLESLARNRGAALSRGAMEVMVTRSQRNEALHEPLVRRHNLPPDLMHEMFFWVSSALRANILATTEDMDESRIDALLAETSRALERGGLPPEDPKWSGPRSSIREREVQDELSPTFVVDLLRRKKIAECIVGFASLADIDESTAQRVLFQAGSEALAVACKAAGFDRNAFSNMMLLTAKEGVHKAGAKFELFDLYDKVTERTAQRTMRFWRTRRRTRLQAAGTGVAPGAERGPVEGQTA